jgi:hypothetical protein
VSRLGSFGLVSSASRTPGTGSPCAGPVATGWGQDLSNQTGICLAHHLHGIHKGFVRVRGKAPDALVGELGLA